MKAQARILAFSIALLAMTLRAFVPAGWMPVAGSGPLVLCTIEGRAHIAIDSEGQPLKQTSDRGSEHQLCSFGTAASLALQEAGSVVPASAAWITVSGHVPQASPVAFDHYTPQSPRAPPRLS